MEEEDAKTWSTPPGLHWSQTLGRWSLAERQCYKKRIIASHHLLLLHNVNKRFLLCRSHGVACSFLWNRHPISSYSVLLLDTVKLTAPIWMMMKCEQLNRRTHTNKAVIQLKSQVGIQLCPHLTQICTLDSNSSPWFSCFTPLHRKKSLVH